MEKEEILVYNLGEEEKLKITQIFSKIGVNVELHEMEEAEDIIVQPMMIQFIRLPEIVEMKLEILDLIEAMRGYQINILVNDKTFEDIEKLQTEIEEAYYDMKSKKGYYGIESVKEAIIGFAVGDAMGVPYEFETREELKKHPVTDMGNLYNYPKGTWSDDTSMTLASMDSIIQSSEIDTIDMAIKFLEWTRDNKYTATGRMFDIGMTTKKALVKFERNQENAEECGEAGEFDNGNGSLMRMLPIAYYIASHKYYRSYIEDEDYEIYEIVKKVSSITHKHEISILGCYIFVKFVLEIIEGKNKKTAYENIQDGDYYLFSEEALSRYDRILKGNIKELKEEEIKSTGYIVDTLEAVLWLFLNSKDYNETILKAVNLGDDTDTISAITGGLLGIYYGEDKIKTEWKNELQKLDYIKELAEKFEKKLENLCYNNK